MWKPLQPQRRGLSFKKEGCQDSATTENKMGGETRTIRASQNASRTLRRFD